ncbi:TetR family transcriptional regulator [Nocardioides silvaticus]|uniref:TetR family transcriptional regulator n=1 Tax=Nocardioides silvaticus TaxID=2201891 RepID=A0A316TIB5_9ACTN|nr:TetR/AcrR family transcriptional regulator [Nocardioides silvaticus]PWN04287.1 TetR family transcriptional regulator [Nocardioides silvaticus]
MRRVPAQIAARLPAAAELFADRGFENTKVDDVAAATGVPKATLYYYFAGKEEILAFLLQETLQQMADEVAIAVQAPDSAAARLAAVVRAQLRVMADQPSVCRALIENLGHAGRIPELASSVTEAYYTPVQQLLDEGVRDGSLRATEDPSTTAMVLFGAVTMSALSYLAAGRPLSPEGLSPAILTVVLDGLRPTDSPP